MNKFLKALSVVATTAVAAYQVYTFYQEFRKTELGQKLEGAVTPYIEQAITTAKDKASEIAGKVVDNVEKNVEQTSTEV